jgi:hypothetical protein
MNIHYKLLSLYSTIHYKVFAEKHISYLYLIFKQNRQEN